MSDSSQSERSEEESKKKVRKSRNDNDGRDHYCGGCEKSYLSSSALYTHVKNKHGGKAPEKNQQPTSDRTTIEPDPLQLIESTINEVLSSEEQELERYFLDQKDDMLLQRLESSWKSSKKSYYRNPDTQSPISTIDQIFGRFLSEMESKVSGQGYVYLQKFILAFHDNIRTEKQGIYYCQENTGQELPQFFNNLIIHSLLPTLIPNEEQHSYQRPTLPCKILFHFGNWIYDQRYTDCSVKFHVE